MRTRKAMIEHWTNLGLDLSDKCLMVTGHDQSNTNAEIFIVETNFASFSVMEHCDQTLNNWGYFLILRRTHPSPTEKSAKLVSPYGWIELLEVGGNQQIYLISDYSIRPQGPARLKIDINKAISFLLGKLGF